MVTLMVEEAMSDITKPYESTSSPASVTADILSPDEDATKNIQQPPVLRARSYVERSRSIEAEVEGAEGSKKLERRVTITAVPVGNNAGNLSIRDSTRAILESMDETQVSTAKREFNRVKLQRRQSQKLLGGGDNVRKTLGEIGRRSSTRRIGSDGSDGHRRVSFEAKEEVDDFFAACESQGVKVGLSRRGSAGSQGSQGSQGSRGEQRPMKERLFSKSAGEFGQLDVSDYNSSEESDDDGAKSGEGDVFSKKRNKSLERRFCKSLEANLAATYEDHYDDLDTSEEGEREESKLATGFNDNKPDEAEQAAVDETLEKIANNHLNGDEIEEELNDTTISTVNKDGVALHLKTSLFPAPARRTRSGRRGGLLHRSKSQIRNWKPLSSFGGSMKDINDDDNGNEDGDGDGEDREGEDSRNHDSIGSGKGGGLGNFWNKLTSSFTVEAQPDQKHQNVEPKPKKEIDGATYFRRGKRKAYKCQFLQAVALFNFALVRQREELGENHIDCGTTLNEIGVCWMMLGERYPALTAFEEALYILQQGLGVGAQEVAETTNNIWMILHEERLEMEKFMEEGEDDEDEE